MKLPIFWELATHIPEIPSNCIIEIYGFESTGKTSLSLYLYKKAIEQDINAIILDTERAIRDNYLNLYELKNVNIQYPKSIKDVFLTIKELKNSLIIWDTLAATPASDELKEVGIASQSREISQYLRIYNQHIKDNNLRLIVINQARLPLTPYQEAVTPGGLSLNFYADIKIFMKKRKLEEDELEVELVVKKNRFAPPQGSSFLVFKNGKIDEIATIIRNAIELKLVEKKPRGYIYKKQDISIKELNNIYAEIEKEIYSKIRGGS